MSFKRFAKILTGAFIVLWGCLSASGAIAEDTVQPNQLIWTSTASTASQFANELSGLYLNLYNKKRLSVVNNVVADSTSIEAVLRRNLILVGPIFPVEIDGLVCDLNSPQLCSRELAAVANPNVSGQDQSLQVHDIAGSVPSRGNWKLTPLDKLILPAVRLERTARWIEVQKTKDSSLEDLVVNNLGGCEKFDASCQLEILKHNRAADRSIFEPGFYGPLFLPVVAVKAAIEISSAEEVSASGSSASPPQKQSDTSVVLQPTGSVVVQPSGTSNSVFKVKEWGSQQSRPNVQTDAVSEKNLVVKQLLPNTIGTISYGAHFAAGRTISLFKQDFVEKQDLLDSLIAFPYHAYGDYPVNVQGGTVGVLDSWIDSKHCAFDGRFIFNNISPGGADAESASCDEQADATDLDHGTHVAGLIGANRPGVSFGLNPYAHVITQEINFDALSSPGKLQEMASVFEKISSQVDVVNMSFGYMLNPALGAHDPNIDVIRNWTGSVLFVAAAGNYGTNSSFICDIRPGCFDTPNVILVAALNGNADHPDLLKSNGNSGDILTNFGSRVHIGAIGENVFSTISSGRYGVLSGTSVAAPQVAAIASLMAKKYKTHTPQEIKNRLIYCSDHLEDLEEKLFGGRLNARCALDADSAEVRLQTVPASLIRGYFQTGASVRFHEAQSSREIVLTIESIRGMQLNKSHNSYTVYFNSDPVRKDSKLIRETNLKPDNVVLDFVPIGGGPLVKVKVDDIDRYTSSIAN